MVIISVWPHFVQASVVINEIAILGTSNDICDGENWLELWNTGGETVSLQSHVLYDDQGLASQDVFRFEADTEIPGGAYLVLCTHQTGSPQFDIGATDTITLARQDGNTLEIFSQVGPLPGTTNTAVPFTYALDSATGLWNYTSTPTPAAENAMTPLPTTEEVNLQHIERLRQQYNEGKQFFNMDDRGYPVPDAMDTVLELKVTMMEADYEYTLQNMTFALYKPFQSAQVFTKTGDEIVSLTSPGRLRPIENEI